MGGILIHMGYLMWLQSHRGKSKKPQQCYAVITFDFKGLYNPIDEIKPNGNGYWEQVSDTVWKWYAYSPLDSLFEGKILAKTNEDGESVAVVDILEIDCNNTKITHPRYKMMVTFDPPDVSELIPTEERTNTFDLMYTFKDCTGISSVGNIINAEEITLFNTFNGCSNLSSVNLDVPISSAVLTFAHCENLNDVTINFNDRITTMMGTFYGCNKLHDANLTSIGSNVKTFASVFYDCTSLENFEFSTNVACDMEYSFKNCTNLQSLNIISDTITDCKGLCTKCSALESFDIGNTNNVNDMSDMFRHCTKLTYIRHLEMDNVHGMGYMFAGCGILEYGDLNLPNVTRIYGLFHSCKNLVSVGDIIIGDTLQSSIGALFAEDHNLETVGNIVISGESFAYAAEVCAYRLFRACGNLKQIGDIIIPYGWNLSYWSNNIFDRASDDGKEYIVAPERIGNIDVRYTKGAYSLIQHASSPDFPKYIGDIYYGEIAQGVTLTRTRTVTQEMGKLYAPNATNMSNLFAYHKDLVEFGGAIDLHTDFNIQNASKLSTKSVHNIIDVAKGVDEGYINVYLHDDVYNNWVNSEYYANDIIMAEQKHIVIRNGVYVTLDITFEDESVSPMSTFIVNDTKWTRNEEVEENNWKCEILITAQDCLQSKFQDVFKNIGNVVINEIDFDGINVMGVTDASKMFYGCSSITSVKSITNAEKLTNLNSMFYGCSSLYEIVEINAVNVTNMGDMFRSCTVLNNVKLINTENVASMNNLFNDCKALSNVDVGEPKSLTDVNNMFRNTALVKAPMFDTSLVTYMHSMFSGAALLETVPQYDTSSCTNMNSMFNGCKKLSSVPTFNTENCTNFESMFRECNVLEEIPAMNTSKGTKFAAMFYNCKLIKSVPKMDTSNGTTFNSMFEGCNAIESIPLINTSKGTAFNGMFKNCWVLTEIPQVDTSNGINLSGMCQSCKTITTAPSFNTSNATNMSYMFAECPLLESVGEYDVSNATSLSYMFNKCYVLTSVQETFNSSKCTTHQYMFADCRALTDTPTIDATSSTSFKYMFGGCNNLKTAKCYESSNVTTMNSMFTSCYLLEHIDGVFNSSKCTDFASMFSNCRVLKKAPIMNTSNGKNLSSMFTACYLLEEVPTLDVSSATAMNSMFNGCRVIKSIKMSGESSNCTNCNNMFGTCYELIDVPTLDISSCTNCENMFSNCRKIKSIELTNKDKVSVTNIKNMFNSCYELEELPLFDTSKVTNAEGFANTCKALKSIPRYNVTAMTNTKNMFNACRYVDRGILDLYNDLSTKSIAVATYSSTFTNCGRDTWGGIAELNKIPTTWGGLGGPTTVLNEYPYEAHNNTKGIDTGVSLFSPYTETACMFFNLGSNTQYSLGINAARKENQSSSTEKIITEGGYVRKSINGVVTNIVSYTNGLKIAIKKENNSLYYTLDGIEWIDFGFDLDVKLYPCNNNSGNMYIAGIWDKAYNGTMGYRYWESVPDDLQTYFT